MTTCRLDWVLDEDFDEIPISELRPEQLCTNCLGPLSVK
jgi:hypothetical protein